MNKHIERMESRIRHAIQTASPQVLATYETRNESTQKELRLTATWDIRLRVDVITPRKKASKSYSDLWGQFGALAGKISTLAHLAHEQVRLNEKASVRTNKGRVRRIELKEEFLLGAGRRFLTELKKATGKRFLATITKQIADIQRQQQLLLPEMRKYNSEYRAARSNALAADRAADTAALESGEFWLASKKALRGYFSPPFERNYLVDMSERWRAALYTEMASSAWKARDGWRHKNVGTGRGYLCGIDDNGDEWGYRVDLSNTMRKDLYGDYEYSSADVADAMAVLFDVSIQQLNECYRQGDLLFRPCMASEMPPASHLESDSEWAVRESHRITSPSLRHKGRYFAAEEQIKVEHTSHQPVILPAGSYCLHLLQFADAD